jgi:hypothetical protein
MHRNKSLALILALAVAGVPLAGCTAQPTTSENAQPTAEQPPPPSAQPAPGEQPPAVDERQARQQPPAAPAPRTEHHRAASTVPEERSHTSAPPPPAEPTTVTLNVPSGTPLSIGFDAEINSGTIASGDPVTATLKQAITVGDRVVFPEGSRVNGVVTDVKSASKGFKDTGGAISIQFKSITAPNGNKTPISAAYSKVATGSAAKKGGIIGGSAVGGALLGRALGKSAGGGAALGAAIGTAVAGTTKGREAKISPEETIQVPLDHGASVTLPR